jgi:hypothetical protein
MIKADIGLNLAVRLCRLRLPHRAIEDCDARKRARRVKIVTFEAETGA